MEVKYLCDGYYSTCLFRGEETGDIRRGYALTLCKSMGTYRDGQQCRHCMWHYEGKPDQRHYLVKRTPKPSKHGTPRLARGRAD